MWTLFRIYFAILTNSIFKKLNFTGECGTNLNMGVETIVHRKLKSDILIIFHAFSPLKTESAAAYQMVA